MDFSTITLADLKRLAPLIEERDAVAARLAEINAALGGFSGMPQTAAESVSKPKPVAKTPKKEAAAASVSKPKPSTGKSATRSGAVKDAILTILRQAPVDGVSVETIAQTLGRKPAAIHVWFYTTGKAIKEIKKVGRSLYAWSGSEA